MKENNCIFCKLANGDIPSFQLYEDEDFKVIFDAFPASFGHALILPKKHYADIFEADAQTIGRGFMLAKKMAEVMKKVFGCDGINILQNNGKEAGQTVFHLHIHLIPRYKGEEKMLTWRPHDSSPEILKEQCAKIAQEMNR